MAMAWRMWAGRADQLLARDASSEGMAGVSADSAGTAGEAFEAVPARLAWPGRAGRFSTSPARSPISMCV